jgi:hypothetical protein
MDVSGGWVLWQKRHWCPVHAWETVIRDQKELAKLEEIKEAIKQKGGVGSEVGDEIILQIWRKLRN